ncbi:splicing factor ESS-2 family protein [Aspergillus ruber CBS 135680]|uniref:Nuclear protein DGCR14 n=1 Tax=Aspergillus ruber (strain CBS 135680) TaxID=1388766 RepID=A0A017SRR6_ASPRC|nr:uncharacterized protein EURHEDRAFT_445327 [Aspergillus ruber CBS 135680]EYE99501.1 hypothetical protein EURHEDRAFT_445327 [Aspergillus ruber CBS 135680]
MANTPSRALTKRHAEQQLMPPPPPPKRIKRPSTILDEEIYTNALSEIISRDFFPGLLETQLKQEYLEALESKDKAWIASSKRKLADYGSVAGGDSGDATLRFTGDGGETPRGWGGDTPMSVASMATTTSTATTTKEPHREIPNVSNMSLLAFQAKYTSEDNESFNKLMDRQNTKKRDKYAWIWNENKVPSARQIAHRTMENKRIAAQGGNPTLAITAGGEDADKEIKTNLDARPAKPDAWDAKPENSLMFLPSSVEDIHETGQQKAEAASRAGPKRVVYQNTRLPTTSSAEERSQPPPSPAISAIQDAIAGRPRFTETEAGAGSYVGGETPRVNGYAFVDEDEPKYPTSKSENNDNSDDLTLLGLGDATPNPFNIRQNRKREDLHHRMVDRITRTKRTEKTNTMKTPVNPRFTSSPRLDYGLRTPASGSAENGGKMLTPAAQMLLRRVGSTPRASSSSSSSNLKNMWTPTPKRK